MFIERPEFVGITEIPETLRSFQSFSKDIVTLLPELEPGKCLTLSFKDEEELPIGRKQILTAGMRLYGSGRVQTGSHGQFLYVWLREKEVSPHRRILEQVKGVNHE